MPTFSSQDPAAVSASVVANATTRRQTSLYPTSQTYGTARVSDANIRPQASTSSLAHLPNELLEEIFQLATYNSTRNLSHLTSLSPFEQLYTQSQHIQDAQALQTKLSLFLTCKLFRKLCTKLLYEDVWVRHGSVGLLHVLSGSNCWSVSNGMGMGMGMGMGVGVGVGVGVGRYVKRVYLCPLAFSEALSNTSQILSLCPNIQVLSQPLSPVSSNSNNIGGSLLTPNDLKKKEDKLAAAAEVLSSLEFSQLYRIDWNNTSADDVTAGPADDGFVIGPDLPFLWQSKTLRVLTLGSDNNLPNNDIANSNTNANPNLNARPTSTSASASEPLINLPTLHTLRIRSADALGDPDSSFFHTIHLPSLKRIILDRPLALYALHTGSLSLYGRQITTLELGRYPRFLRIDAISIGLGYCPNVENLLFSVFTTMPPAKNHLGSPQEENIEYKVKSVGLNASVETDCDYQVSQTWMWVQLSDLVEALTGEGTRFRKLEEVKLYGDEWRELMMEAEDGNFGKGFQPIARTLQTKGIRVVSEDAVTSELLARMLV